MKKYFLLFAFLMPFLIIKSQPNPEDVLDNIDRFKITTGTTYKGVEEYKTQFGLLFNGLDYVLFNKNFISESSDPHYLRFRPNCKWLKIKTITLGFFRPVFYPSAKISLDYFRDEENITDNNVSSGAAYLYKEFYDYCKRYNIPIDNITEFKFNFDDNLVDGLNNYSLKTKSITITYFECLDLNQK